MSGFAAIVASLGALSLTITKIVDFVRNAIDKNNTYPKWVWNLVALAAGVVFCLGWQIDLTGAVLKLIPALQNARLTGVAGQVLTGVIVGGSAGFWHELLDALSGIASSRHAAAQNNYAQQG